jgi:hypothetical protein
MDASNLYPAAGSGSTDPGLRFEIVESESESEVRDKLLPRAKSLACDHTQVLDMLNEGMDQHAEVASLLERVMRALWVVGGR